MFALKLGESYLTLGALQEKESGESKQPKKAPQCSIRNGGNRAAAPQKAKIQNTTNALTPSTRRLPTALLPTPSSLGVIARTYSGTSQHLSAPHSTSSIGSPLEEPGMGFS